MQRIAILSFAFLLFSFKYPIEGFGGTGIRGDDFVIAFFMGCLLLARRMRLVFPDAIRGYILFIGVSIFSTLVSAMVGSGASAVQSLVYCFRLVEYATLFYIGTYLPRRNYHLLLVAFVFYQFAIVMAQQHGLLAFGTHFNVAERQSGSAGGPWELAVIAAFPFFYFLERKNYVLVGLCAFLVYATESRITGVAVLAVVCAKIIRTQLGRSSLRQKLIVVVLLTACLGVAAFQSDVVASSSFVARFSEVGATRIANFGVAGTQSISQAEYKSMDADIIKRFVSTVNGDPSTFSRLSRWTLALRTLLSYPPLQLIFGLGPSFFGDALDGAFVRLFVTTGLLGCIVYFGYTYRLLVYLGGVKKSYVFNYLLVYLISCSFIDVLYALKPNVMLFAGLGVIYADAKRSGALRGAIGRTGEERWGLPTHAIL